MEVYRIGSKVNLGERLQGLIVSINIKPSNYVSYQCVWWDGKTRKEGWFDEIEIEGTYEDKIKIGYK